MVTNHFCTPTFTTKGGTGLYVKNIYRPFERTDLKYQSNSCESIFIEISNSRSKNIICGSIYRHPGHNTEEFLSYLEHILKLLVTENKELYLCGDFNILTFKV